MALLTVRGITINAVNPTALAAFWAELVGGVPADSCNGFILPSHPSEQAGQPPEAARVRNWRQPSTSASGAVMPSWDWMERTASRVASS